MAHFSCLLALGGGVTDQALDDDDVLPLAVEATVAPVDADLPPAARSNQRDARFVRGEDLPDQLVAAAALGLSRQRVEQGGADPASASFRVDVEGHLGHAGVVVV